MIFMCEICGELGKEVRVVGGLCATLCNKHRNEWHEFTQENDLYGELCVTSVEIQAYIAKGEAELASSKSYKMLMLERRLYNESKHWIESKKGSRE